MPVSLMIFHLAPSPGLLYWIFNVYCVCLPSLPISQGAPVPECCCCFCHTCSASRPSYLPLSSVSPGVQVLPSFILSFHLSLFLIYPHTVPSPLLTISPALTNLLFIIFTVLRFFSFYFSCF